MRTGVVAIFCLVLSGCYVKAAGNQSTSGGATTTTTSGQVSGTAQGANYKASFSSGGQPVSPKAQGGYVSASGNAAAVLLISVGIVEFLNYVAGTPPPKPLPPGEAIGHTCSCYGYQPAAAPRQRGD